MWAIPLILIFVLVKLAEGAEQNPQAAVVVALFIGAVIFAARLLNPPAHPEPQSEPARFRQAKRELRQAKSDAEFELRWILFQDSERDWYG
ncbi:hypothetical protein QFZ36_000545 [Pseudarthrobacter siccitolerans]|uniref:Uncharacterized protein n=1 Tax=Pseudarthrobacter siccitolerans TaxID=861266 RepID=A0ABU0PG96_9MICC|nr:hypothetical protein [Pseudarthrobacter siccitolerans]